MRDFTCEEHSYEEKETKESEGIKLTKSKS